MNQKKKKKEVITIKFVLKAFPIFIETFLSFFLVNLIFIYVLSFFCSSTWWIIFKIIKKYREGGKKKRWDEIEREVTGL